MTRKWLLYGNVKRYVSAASLSLAVVVCSHVQWFISIFLEGGRLKIREVTLSARIFGEAVKKLLCITPAFFMTSVNSWLYGQYLSFMMVTHCVYRLDSIYWWSLLILELLFTACCRRRLLGGVTMWLFAFQLMIFGFFLCVDAFLYVFTLLPLRVLLAVLRLLTLPCCGFRSEPKHTLSNL